MGVILRIGQLCLIAIVATSPGCKTRGAVSSGRQLFDMQTLFQQDGMVLVAHYFVGQQPSLSMCLCKKGAGGTQGEHYVPTPPVISFVWTFADDAGGKTYRCDFLLLKAHVIENTIEHMRIVLLPENKVRLSLARPGKVWCITNSGHALRDRDDFAVYEGTGREISGQEIPPIHAVRVAKERVALEKTEAGRQLPPVLGSMEGGRYTSIDGMFSILVPQFPGGRVSADDHSEGKTVGQNYLVLTDDQGRKLKVMATFVPQGGGHGFLDRYLATYVSREKHMTAGYFETGFVAVRGERVIQSALRDQKPGWSFPSVIEFRPDKRGAPSESLRWWFMRGELLFEVDCLYPCPVGEDRGLVKAAIRKQVETVFESIDTPKAGWQLR